MRESWLRAFLLAIPIAIWLFALAVVSAAGAYNWDIWRTDVARFKADLDPQPRADDEDVQARITWAAQGLSWTNHNHGTYVGVFAAIAVVLIAVAVLYRWRVPRERRPSWRTWVFVVPFVAGLVHLAMTLLGYAMHGVITD